MIRDYHFWISAADEKGNRKWVEVLAGDHLITVLTSYSNKAAILTVWRGFYSARSRIPDTRLERWMEI